MVKGHKHIGLRVQMSDYIFRDMLGFRIAVRHRYQKVVFLV